jgi:hypothetical protein
VEVARTITMAYSLAATLSPTANHSMASSNDVHTPTDDPST